jgi:FAD/FMN-containing dehydrogenase
MSAAEGAGATEGDSGHAARCERLLAQYRSTREGVRLAKGTSNLFRDRTQAGRALDVRDFHHVLAVDATACTIDVEGMATFAQIVDATLPHGVMPPVVPELRSITIGGAISGVGIEASSFRYGLVHETVQELEILTGDGEIVVARPDNEHADLFFGFPNAYGTLGYVLRARILAVPVAPYVHLRHVPYDDPARFFADLAHHCRVGEADFIDGTVFASDELYLTLATFVSSAPWTSDYTFDNIYYQSIRQHREDYLRVHDYIWRWDTDWFWCSKNVYAQNPIVRRLLGRKRLNSVTYQRIMRLNARWHFTALLNQWHGLYRESVIQDVDIPIEHAPAFLAFFEREIGIRPIWICPIRAWRRDRRFDLYPLDPDTLYINFGFWDVIRTRTPYPPGHFNRQVERKVAELGGLKSLYSSSYYERDAFWQPFDRDAYRRLKERYDPSGRLKDLYDKTVLGA